MTVERRATSVVVGRKLISLGLGAKDYVMLGDPTKIIKRLQSPANGFYFLVCGYGTYKTLILRMHPNVAVIRG